LRENNTKLVLSKIAKTYPWLKGDPEDRNIFPLAYSNDSIVYRADSMEVEEINNASIEIDNTI